MYLDHRNGDDVPAETWRPQSFLALLGCTRFGSPGIFGKMESEGRSIQTVRIECFGQHPLGPLLVVEMRESTQDAGEVFKVVPRMEHVVGVV